MDSVDYINKVVGKPWVNRAEGPDAFDCWGLVIDSFKKIDKIDLPQLTGYLNAECCTHDAAKDAFNQWEHERCEPCDGAIMTSWQGDTLVHVGRCLNGGVLHATDGLGVRFDKYRVINAIHQKTEYYKYVGNTAP